MSLAANAASWSSGEQTRALKLLMVWVSSPSSSARRLVVVRVLWCAGEGSGRVHRQALDLKKPTSPPKINHVQYTAAALLLAYTEERSVLLLVIAASSPPARSGGVYNRPCPTPRTHGRSCVVGSSRYVHIIPTVCIRN